MTSMMARYKNKSCFFQADPLISKRALSGNSHMIVGADTDFFVSVELHCILLKDFKFKRQRGRQSSNVALMELNELQLCCSNIKMRNKIEEALVSESCNDGVEYVDAKYPFLDEEVIHLRALMAVFLGCDVYIDGIAKGIGPAKISKKLEDLREKYKDDDLMCI